MAVLGIDMGTTNMVVGAAQQSISIIPNDLAQRLTPCLVSFGANGQRFVGEHAIPQMSPNYRNTIHCVKRLIGRRWDDPEFQSERPLLGFATLRELPENKIGIDVQFKGETVTLRPEHVMAILLKKVKTMAEKFTETKAADFAISVPGYWNDQQRRAMFDACQLADMNCVKLVSDIAAVATNWGFYKLDLSDQKPLRVMFIDMGSFNYSVGIVEFGSASLKVLSTAYDRNFGGRQIDKLLADYCASQFEKKYKIDPHKYPKSWMRLLTACEKAKQNLNINSMTQVIVEALVECYDLQVTITQKQYEQMLQPLFSRLLPPILHVLSESKLQVSDLFRCEWVGSGMRVVVLRKFIEQQLKIQLHNTVNAEEANCNGCVLNVFYWWIVPMPTHSALLRSVQR